MKLSYYRSSFLQSSTKKNFNLSTRARKFNFDIEFFALKSSIDPSTSKLFLFTKKIPAKLSIIHSSIKNSLASSVEDVYMVHCVSSISSFILGNNHLGQKEEKSGFTLETFVVVSYTMRGHDSRIHVDSRSLHRLLFS